MTCEGCGSSSWHVVERLGALETWECGVCGFKTEVHSDPIRESDVPAPSGPVLVVEGYWLSPPTAARITELKRIFPDLANEQLAQHARHGTSFSLGRYGPDAIPHLEGQLGPLGIGLRLTPV